MAATLNWIAPSQYTNNDPIPAAKVATITYKLYTGPALAGPWTLATTTAQGATTGTAPSPASGGTLWYTIDATLDGQISAKATAVSLTVPFQVPKAPTGLTVN
jgi:hypothetical protein